MSKQLSTKYGRSLPASARNEDRKNYGKVNIWTNLQTTERDLPEEDLGQKFLGKKY